MQQLAKSATPKLLRRRTFTVPDAVQVTACGLQHDSSVHGTSRRQNSTAALQVTRQAEQLVFEGPLGRNTLPLAKIDPDGSSALQARCLAAPGSASSAPYAALGHMVLMVCK